MIANDLLPFLLLTACGALVSLLSLLVRGLLPRICGVAGGLFVAAAGVLPLTLRLPSDTARMLVEAPVSAAGLALLGGMLLSLPKKVAR